MVTPLTLQRWADVETEDDFIAYLGLLVADARHPENGWTFRDLPAFLHGWARWIDDALEHGDHTEVLAAPSRRALAGQLFHARTAAPPSRVGAPVVLAARRVKSAADLAGWLRHLGDDCLDDDTELRKRAARGGWAGEGRWAHGTNLASYLDAWRWCLVDTRSRRSRLKARTWAQVAQALADGKFYE